MAAGDYYDQAETKIFLHITATDTSDDAELDQLGNKADRQVDNDLSWHLESFPVAVASITDDLKAAANVWTCHLYKLARDDLDASNQFRTLYRDIIKGIKQRFVSAPTGRTQRRAVTKAYLSDPMKNDFDEGLL